jgi:hypothetical protein
MLLIIIVLIGLVNYALSKGIATGEAKSAKRRLRRYRGTGRGVAPSAVTPSAVQIQQER